MDMSGEYLIPAPRETVWNALNDPEILKLCIPGCEEVEKTSETSFAAKVVAKVGPVRAKFAGKVTLSDIDPPNAYTISGEGTGGAAGFAKGGARVSLSDDPIGTKLVYTVDATVGGKLAQIGSRLIDSAARKMANDFFGKFAEIVGAGSGATTEASRSPPSSSGPGGSGPAASAMAPLSDDTPEAPGSVGTAKAGLAPMIWVSGIVVTLAILLFLFQSRA